MQKHHVDLGLKTRDDEIEPVENFQYMGSWISDSGHDFNSRKVSAWIACNKMRKVWASKMARRTKMRRFRVTVDSVLLYGSETWTATTKLKKSVNGCYTRMLRMALNVQWQKHMNNQELYGSLPRVSEKIRVRRLRLAGHCARHNEEIASKALLWEPQHGHPNRGRRRTTYIDTIKADTILDNTKEIRDAMLDQVVWKDFIRTARDDSRLK